MSAQQRCVTPRVASLCSYSYGPLQRIDNFGFPQSRHVVQVWTYKGRVAFVLSVLEKNKPIADRLKLQRLSQIMLDIMGGDLGIVSMDQVWF